MKEELLIKTWGKVLEKFVVMNSCYLLSLDGTGYFSSDKIHCDSCLGKTNQKTGKVSYSHQMLAAAIVHPDFKQVIPLTPEPIIKQDGQQKNDCERNACKRFFKQLRKDHPHLRLIIIEDALSSNAPHIRDLQQHHLHYILGVKKGDHPFLFQYVEEAYKAGKVTELEFKLNGIIHRFRFINQVPLNASNQDVLVVKENSAEIVRTPVSRSSDNVWISKIVGRLTSGGTLFFEGSISTMGTIGASRRNTFNDLKPEECQRKVSRIIGNFAPVVDLQDYQIINLSENFDQPFIIKFKGTIDKFGVITANRIFINPNIFNRQTQDDIPDQEKRKFPVHFYYAFQEVDSLTIVLPEGFEIEAAPDSMTLEAPFCAYKTSYCVENGSLKYSRIFDSIYNQIPISMYEAYCSFLKKVVKSDNAKFVLTKNDSF